MLEIISTYLGIFILAIGEVLFAKIVLNKNIQVNKLKLLLIFLSCTISCTITYIFFDGVFKTFLIYIIHVLEI